MEKHRLLAMTDGVVAIIITIMVLELKAPEGTDFHALHELWPVFFAYALSFIYVAIYWNNHHHYFHLVSRVNGAVLWANFHLLFWLSLIPFTTGWLGENHAAPLPVAAYGAVLLCCAIAYTILNWALIRNHEAGSLLSKSSGVNTKGMFSIVSYVAAIPLAFVNPWISCALYVAVAFSWLIPERRIEREMEA